MSYNAKLFPLSLQTPAAVTDAAKRKAAFGWMDPRFHHHEAARPHDFTDFCVA